MALTSGGSAVVAVSVGGGPGGGGGRVVRRTVAADNSCLFNSVAYCLEGGDLSKGAALRGVVAAAVRDDPRTYDEGMLGKSSEAYQAYIQNADHWGGGIELAVLSRHYATTISAADIQTGRLCNFGEDAAHPQRCFLLYDGIHYDPVALSLADGVPDLTVFTAGSEEERLVEEGVLRLTGELRRRRQFTNLAAFTLRCLVCQAGLVGQKEAQTHAKQTGHTNFAEA